MCYYSNANFRKISKNYKEFEKEFLISDNKLEIIGKIIEFGLEKELNLAMQHFSIGTQRTIENILNNATFQEKEQTNIVQNPIVVRFSTKDTTEEVNIPREPRKVSAGEVKKNLHGITSSGLWDTNATRKILRKYS